MLNNAIKEKRYKTNYIIYSIAIGIIVSQLWFIPMISQSGGLSAYFDLYRSKQSQFPRFTTGKNLVEFFSYFIWAFLPISILLIPFLKSNLKKQTASTGKTITGIALWFVPPILFFMFMHIAKGYLLLCMTALFLLYAIYVQKSKFPSVLISIIIVLQTMIFAFYPYKIADDSINFNANSRSISKAQVWLQRMNSSYAVTYNQIEYYKELYIDLKYAVRDIQNLNRGEAHLIFVDPSCMAKIRSFPIIYSKNIFAKFNFDSIVSTSIYYSTKEDYYSNSSELLGNNFVIGNKSFIKKYCVDMIEIAHEYKHLAIYKVKSANRNDYLNKLNKLYNRN